MSKNDTQIQAFKASQATTLKRAQEWHDRQIDLLERFGLPDQDVVHHVFEGTLACRKDVKGWEGRSFLFSNCHNSPTWERVETKVKGGHKVSEKVTCPECLATK